MKVEKKYMFDYYKIDGSNCNRFYADQWGYHKSGEIQALSLHEEFNSHKFITESNDYFADLILFGNLYSYCTASRSNNSSPHLSFLSLKSITYPTGGSTVYEYEPNKYANILFETAGGGQRIKKIITNSESGSIETIYKYGHNEDGLGEPNITFTAGAFAKEITHIKFTGRLNDQSYYPRMIRIYSGNPIGNASFSHFKMSYPKVTVYKFDSNAKEYLGKTVSEYTTTSSLNTMEVQDPSVSGIYCNHLSKNHAYTLDISNYNPAHKYEIKSRINFDKNGIKKQEELFDYSMATGGGDFSGLKVYQGITAERHVLRSEQETAVTMRHSNPYNVISSFYSYERPTLQKSNTLLSKKQTILYDGIYPLTNIESYIYDSSNRLKATIQSSSIGANVTITKKLTYPAADTELYKKNMVSTVVKTETVNNQTPTNSIINVYDKTSILPKAINVLYKNSLIEHTMVIFNKYDSKGNLLQYTGKDGVPISYFWSYNYQYPIAEFKNMTYAQAEVIIKAHFGIASADVLAKSFIPDEAKIRSLAGVNSPSHITTYTYKPLVGMLSATDSKGVTTYYEYDSFGRLFKTLIGEKDSTGKEQKKALETYEYNYKNK